MDEDGLVAEALPERMPSGERVALTLSMTAPRAPGDYVCELDLAHEGVAWFADNGSKTVRIPVAVLGFLFPLGARRHFRQHFFPVGDTGGRHVLRAEDGAPAVE